VTPDHQRQSAQTTRGRRTARRAVRERCAASPHDSSEPAAAQATPVHGLNIAPDSSSRELRGKIVTVSMQAIEKISRQSGKVPLRVLVCDEELLIRWSVGSALTAAGFDVVSASTPEEARSLAAEWPPPRVALLDMPPDRRGRELLTDIRAVYPRCRFFLMSTARQDPSGAMPEEGIRTIEKPFDLANLVAQVADAAQEPAGRGLTTYDGNGLSLCPGGSQ
jgi:CheY-like chemotaxis protein